jgi:hypothetical protein
MKRKVILIVTISLIMNGFLPKYALCSQEYDALFTLIENQPLLQYYFSLSSIPVNIVSRLCTDQNTPLTATKQGSPHRRPGSSTSPNEFSVNLSGNRDNLRNPLSRLAWLGNRIGASSPGEVQLHDVISRDRYWQRQRVAHYENWGSVIFLLVILMLLALLPRGALSDEYSIRNKIFRKDPIWNISRSGLFIGGDK